MPHSSRNHQMGQHICNECFSFAKIKRLFSAKQGSNTIEWSLNTHDEYCDILLTLGAYIIVELVLMQGIHTTLSWSMSYENVLLKLQQRLRATGSVHRRHLWIQLAHGLYGYQE